MIFRQQGLNIIGVLSKLSLQLGEPFGGHMVRCQARVEAVGGLDPGPGQGEPETDPTGQTGQEPPPSDVREEADAGLGHGEGRALGGEAVAGRGREADAAAHGDPVHHRDDRLRIGKEQMIQSVLGEKEGARQAAVRGAAVGQHADIAPGAEAALAGMVDQHRLDSRIPAPVRKDRYAGRAHNGREGVEGLGPIQGQPPQPAVARDPNLLAHRPKISRLMMTRMISLVPSRIWWTRRSRTIRSRG